MGCRRNFAKTMTFEHVTRCSFSLFFFFSFIATWEREVFFLVLNDQDTCIPFLFPPPPLEAMITHGSLSLSKLIHPFGG